MSGYIDPIEIIKKIEEDRISGELSRLVAPENQDYSLANTEKELAKLKDALWYAPRFVDT